MSDTKCVRWELTPEMTRRERLQWKFKTWRESFYRYDNMLFNATIVVLLMLALGLVLGVSIGTAIKSF